MGADGRLFVLYDYENGRICQFSLHRSRTRCPFRTACPEQKCRGAGRQWRPQKAAGILKHRPSRQARPQPFEGSQGGTPCPSDMMLCVISYWVLSGAKRRQIQQLRCCALSRQAVEMKEASAKPYTKIRKK